MIEKVQSVHIVAGGLLEKDGKFLLVNAKNFGEAMALREEADYDFKFSDTGALETMENAKEFLTGVKKILGDAK